MPSVIRGSDDFDSNGIIVQGTAKAWVNFNGTGTVAIRASYNVSSITDNGTGDYTINFTNAMPDTNYSICSSSTRGSLNPNTDAGGAIQVIKGLSSYLTTSVSIQFIIPAWNFSDQAICNVAVFG